VISNTAKENKKALRLMKRYLKAGAGPSQCISFGNESGFGTKDLTVHDADGTDMMNRTEPKETKAVEVAGKRLDCLSYHIFKVFWASISWRRHGQHRKCYLVKRLEMGRAILMGSANS
jgi:hypothetical protein